MPNKKPPTTTLRGAVQALLLKSAALQSWEMFFLKELNHKVQVTPEHFGPNLRSAVTTQLTRDLALGYNVGRFGYIVSVLDICNFGNGKILDGIGSAEFELTYRAIVFKPFRGEVVDAVVSSANKMGFFAELGPVNVFVSTHLIPEDFTFDVGDGSSTCSFGNEDGSLRIAKDSKVRLRIIGTRVDATEIFAIGTIKEDFLGLI